jgi:hypothetical protein
VPVKYVNFNPYKEDDVLIFKSNTNFDTVIVTRVREKHVDRQNLPYFVGRNSLQISGVSLSDYGFSRNRLATSPIVYIYPKKSLPANRLYFGLHLNESYNLNSSIHNLDSLMNLPSVSLLVNNKEYNDVVVIKTDGPGKNRTSDVLKVYWSKSAGIIRMVNRNKDSTDLVKKYQNRELYNKYKDTPSY